MKERYIDLMEKTLLAYSDEHIQRYFNDVRRDGLTEHGFPRLTANIGILISHGRRTDLLPVFLEMMDFCCKSIPVVKAANDFSVREIINCITSIECAGVVKKDKIDQWKNLLATVDVNTSYNVIAKTQNDRVKNWALFTAVSEFFRQKMGLCNSADFIDIQLATQLYWLDDNGMYMDGNGNVHHPIVYDIVPRALFSMLLDAGYRGRYYEEIDSCLKRAGLLTLKMQSPNGEIPFGGRSNQFLHNEPWVTVIYEYEAKRYEREGNRILAAKFKSAIERALSITESELAKKPILHTKNRFPTESKYGCEGYAYFDKYMITLASCLHAAYLICDDTIPFDFSPDHEPVAFMTSKHFHKLFLKAGGYGVEFDLNGDSHYDASGLGRVHRERAPSAICLSHPCPSHPNFTVDIDNPVALSLCPAVYKDNNWLFATEENAKCEVVRYTTSIDSATAELIYRFIEGSDVKVCYTVNGDGVHIRIDGDGAVSHTLPAFLFDGEIHTEVSCDNTDLSVSYQKYICRYSTNGAISDTGILAANRNGHYKAYVACGTKHLEISIKILDM